MIRTRDHVRLSRGRSGQWLVHCHVAYHLATGMAGSRPA
ncbi:multicopper oxidase domain-containing protein [Halosaccharopolyspora lacisalsi]